MQGVGQSIQGLLQELGVAVADEGGQPFYSRWMQEFACLMNGNWYSTQAVSECNGEPDDSCWWQLLSPVRGEVVVNGESSNGLSHRWRLT